MVNVPINSDTLRALSCAMNPKGSVQKLYIKIDGGSFADLEQLIKTRVSKYRLDAEPR